MKTLGLILVLTVVSMGSIIQKTEESKVNVNYDGMEEAVSKNEFLNEVLQRFDNLVNDILDFFCIYHNESSSLNNQLLCACRCERKQGNHSLIKTIDIVRSR